MSRVTRLNPLGTAADLATSFTSPAEATGGNRLTELGLTAKGGSIGTFGKAVVSIRFDHHLAPLRDTIWPLMVARGLPASVGIVSRWPTGDTFSTGVTWSDLHTMVRDGLEVWCHSATHGDPTTYAALVDEIVTSKAEIEAQGFKTMGWQVPGVTTTVYTDWQMGTVADMYGPVARLVNTNHAFSEGYYPGSGMRVLPHRQFHSLNHTTIEALSVAAIQNAIKQAVAYNCGVQLMLHPGYIGTPTYLTLADLTTVLDYIVTHRDLGEFEVLTATGLIAADPGGTSRVNLLGNSSFDPDYSVLWTGWNNGAGIQLKTDGGHTGANYLRLTSTTAGTLNQATSQPLVAGMAGGAFRVEAWMRAPSTTAKGTIRVVDNSTPANFDVTKTFTISTIGVWQRVWFNTVLHPSTGTLRIELNREQSTAADIDMDDITITPV